MTPDQTQAQIEAEVESRKTRTGKELELPPQPFCSRNLMFYTLLDTQHRGHFTFENGLKFQFERQDLERFIIKRYDSVLHTQFLNLILFQVAQHNRLGQSRTG